MRYENTMPNDTVRAQDGDIAFVGVDERRDPRQLEPGLVSRAINKDFIQGVAMTRRGMQTVGWAAERATCFPLCFTERDYEFLDLFGPDTTTYEDKSFRVNHGTTLELYCPNTAKWHAIWLSLAAGVPVLTIDADGTADEDWDYQDYDEANANFRIVNDRTLQLWCVDTAGFHTVWLIGSGPALTLAADATASTPAGEPDANWLVSGGALSILNADTSAHHSIWISDQAGIPVLTIDAEGTPEPGICFDDQTGFGEVFGTAVFSDPFGVEGLLVAVRNGLYRIMPNQVPQIIRLPDGEVITSACRMIQCFDRVVILRGPDADPLVWYPRQTTDAGLGAVEVIEQTGARGADADNTYGDGTEPIPRVSDGVQHANRLFLIDGRDDLIVSDILDYTRYSEATQRFKINNGEDDQLLRVMPYNQTSLILFKTQSIYVMDQVYGNLGNVRADVLSSEYGLVGRDAAVSVGKDVFFLSEAGVFALSQALDNKLQAGNEPVSAPIQPIINRINWTYATGAQMAYHDNRLYLAVPLDGARYNNTILVYNFLNRAWSGSWTGALVDVHSFFKINYAGRRELWFMTGTSLEDGRHGAGVLLNSDRYDYAFGTIIGIGDELVTRGYSLQHVQQKDYRRVVVDHSTWSGAYTIDAQGDGVSESRQLASKTPDRTKYAVWGRGRYNETNDDDDHGEAYREDYSVRLHGQNILYLRSGIGLGRMQRRQDAFQPRVRGSFIQLRIRNSGGRHGIHGIIQEAKEGRRSNAPYM